MPVTVNMVIAGLIVVAAALGLAFVKVGELAGLGRPAPRGSLRAPHGRLVRTRCLDAPAALGFAARLARLGAPLLVVLALSLAVGLAGLLPLGGVLLPSLELVAAVAVGLGLTYADAGPWRALGYALAGYLVGGVAATAAGLGVMPGDGAAINGLTLVAGTALEALALAWMPPKRAWAREFEDGHVNAIRVSDRSAAARAYAALADAAWQPPADRIRHAHAHDVVRAARKGGDEDGE